MKIPPSRRLERLRAFSRLLDSSIPLPGGYRVGIDGLIGLIPGIGDIAGGAASSYIIIEAARLGASTPTLLRMVFNVLLETLIGQIPFLGDLFDFVWKANVKNVALLEKQFQRSPPPESSPEQRLKITVAVVLFILLAGIAALSYLGFVVLFQVITALIEVAGST